MSDFPAPPLPTSIDDLLPPTGEKFLMDIDTKTKVFLTWNRTDGPGTYMIASDPSQPDFPGWVTDKPPPYHIVRRGYWKLISQEVIQPGGHSTIDKAYSTGSSTTDTQTFSAELGAEGGGVSVKLSVGFSKSITIDENTTVTTGSGWENPYKYAVQFANWQRVQEFSIETTEYTKDPNGKSFPAGSLLSDVMRADANGVSAYKSGIAGSGHVGYVYCQLGCYTNSLEDREQSIFPVAPKDSA